MFFAGLYILGCFLLRFILYNIISSLKKELCVQLQKKKQSFLIQDSYVSLSVPCRVQSVGEQTRKQGGHHFVMFQQCDVTRMGRRARWRWEMAGWGCAGRECRWGLSMDHTWRERKREKTEVFTLSRWVPELIILELFCKGMDTDLFYMKN